MKKTCFDLKVGRLCTFLVEYGARRTGIDRKRYSGCWFLNILLKRQNFLYQLRNLRENLILDINFFFLCTPNCSVIARLALY